MITLIISVKNSSTEEEIIELLRKNARASYSEIAEKVGISEPTVRKFIQNLENSEAILGYSAEIDPKKLKNETVAIVGIDTENDSFLEVIDSLKDIKEITEIYTSSGDHEIIVKVSSENNESLHRTISEKISNIEGIKASYPSVLHERIK